MNTMNFTFLGGKPGDAFIARIDTHGFVLVGVPRNKIAQAINSDDVPSQGIYFLVNTKEGKFEERYLYVGQTKTGPHRLNDHRHKKAEWDMAYMFLAPKYLFPLQIADELEALEIAKYKNNEAFNFVNEKPNRAEPGIEARRIGDIIEDIMTFLGYGAEESLLVYLSGKLEDEEAKEEPEKKEMPSTVYYANTKIDLSGTKPVYCRFMNKEYDDSKVRTFRSLILIVAKGLYTLNPSVLEELCSSKTGRGKKAKKPTFTDDSSELRRPLEVSDKVFVEGNVSSGDACKIIEFMLTKYGIKQEDFCFSVSRN